jgi:hypothetical protein
MVTVTQPATVTNATILRRRKCKVVDLDSILNRAPKRSREQAGHLRHFHNLLAQLDGEWRYMESQEPGQEFLDAYRWVLFVYRPCVANVL